MAASHSLACHSSRATNFKAFGWCLQACLLRNARHQQQSQLLQSHTIITNTISNTCLLFLPLLRCRHLSFAAFGPHTSAGPVGSPAIRGSTVQCSSASATSLADPESRQINTDCPPSVPTFQNAIQCLQNYWASVGCAIMQSSNTEVPFFFSIF
ncbi:hypothetical protein L7F22_009462 [Adiantum nelumboides]|nr:hypothetical protein [Adiantum nelumboides]